jgi:hypothetical protein
VAVGEGMTVCGWAARGQQGGWRRWLDTLSLRNCLGGTVDMLAGMNGCCWIMNVLLT